MQKTMIRSPINGEFVSSSIAPGDMILANQALGRINSHSHLIEVSLNEEDFAGMKEGLSAGVTRCFHSATKSSMPKSTDSHPWSTPRPAAGSCTSSSIRIKNCQLEELDAEIIKSVRKQALIIPRMAVVGNSVFVESNGVTHLREIRTGAKNLTEVEILDGLKENERVITQTPHLFRDGQSVKKFANRIPLAKYPSRLEYHSLRTCLALFVFARKRAMAMSLVGIVFGIAFFIVTQAQTSGFEVFFVRTILGTNGAVRVSDRFQDMEGTVSKASGDQGGAFLFNPVKMPVTLKELNIPNW